MKSKYCQKKGCNYLAFHAQVPVCQAMETRTKDHLKVLGRALWKLEECPKKIFEPKPEKLLISKVKRDSQGLTYTYIPAKIRDIFDMQTSDEFKITTNGKQILLTPLKEVTLSA